MINNKHIIKTLSNTIYFFLLLGVLFSINVLGMTPVQTDEQTEETTTQIIPGPNRPPYDN